MRTLLATSLLLLGCGGAPAPSSASPAATGSVEATRAGELTNGPSADYEVHEWGLVRAGAADTLDVTTVPHVDEVPPLVVLKPVLYFHAPSALTLRSVIVEARSGGTIREAWPLVPLGARVAWSDVSIDLGSCTPSALPTVTEAPCAGLPATEPCEAATLATARTTDAACVHAGGATERFLFYRSTTVTFTPPLRVTRDPDGTVHVTNEGPQVVPGMLLRITGALSREVAPPAPHHTVDIAVPTEAGPGSASIAGSMEALGLTHEEIAAFLEAWEPTLFARIGLALDLSLAPSAPTDTLLYFLPAGALEDVAHLELDPPPRGGVHCAIALWTALP
jgi:hypothetical protein